MSKVEGSTCKSIDASRKDVKPGPPASKDMEDQREEKEPDADADNGGEGFDSDGDRNESSSLRAIKTRRRSAESGKPLSKGCIKRRRLPSSLLIDEGIETEIESDISSFTSSKRDYTSTLQPTSSHLTGLKGDVSEDRAMEPMNK